jgi:DUF4097 and DUF4098 domain-containing protein YvlB
MKNRVLIAAIFLALTISALGQGVRKGFRAEHKFAIAPGGSFVLENPVGSVDIIGVDTPDIGGISLTTITARTPEALEEGRKQTTVIVGGDQRKRILRANVAQNHDRDWRASVDWSIRVPRSAHVRVISHSGARIRVMNLTGNVHVTNVNGQVVVHNNTGTTIVESINGSLVYSAPQLGGNTILSTVNGNVTASVAPGSDFHWVAETLKGDIRTNFPVKGSFFGTAYRAIVNAPGGPTVTTASIMGNVFLYAQGAPVATARSVRTPAAPSVVPAMVSAGTTIVEPVKSFFRYQTNLGDVKVREIYGDADIFTGAGEVRLGLVRGSARVVSRGGPLHFGDILGAINASTRAGDVYVESARRGGTIATHGGTIRLMNALAPTHLQSGGGDIIVRRAAAPVKAETTSGDVSITIDAGSKTENIEAKTSKGNIVLYVHSAFAADVDATIVTADPSSDTIASDLPGLSISREEIGGKTRVRAVGKLNGGGERVVLEVVGGDIRITTAAPR